MSLPVGLKLDEYPTAIAQKAGEILQMKDELSKLQSKLADADNEIERTVMKLDKKEYPNEAARDVYRHERRASVGYAVCLNPVTDLTYAIKSAEIELQYLRDAFSVSKLQLQDAIASASQP